MADVTPYVQLGLGGVALFLMYKVLIRVLEVIGTLSTSIDKNTSATNELYTYIKVRNGTLERLVIADPKIKKAAKEVVKRK